MNGDLRKVNTKYSFIKLVIKEKIIFNFINRFRPFIIFIFPKVPKYLSIFNKTINLTKRFHVLSSRSNLGPPVDCFYLYVLILIFLY